MKSDEKNQPWLNCEDRDIGSCGVYCLAWKRAGYSGSHPTCHDIITGNIPINTSEVPYFKCPRGYTDDEIEQNRGDEEK